MSNRNPLEAILDAMVYAPLGAVLVVSEELPKLAEKGRAKVNERLGAARVVGQFVVAQGQRETERRLGARRDRVPPTMTGADDQGAEAPIDQADGLSLTPRGPRPGDEADAGLLAIPGYDALSAPQVVQRLAGLSPEEREAVRAYEATHRARQTILARVAQLHNQQ